MQSPETNTSDRLRAIHAKNKALRQELTATLHLHGPNNDDYDVPLACAWCDLPGRPGVKIYHVPDPTGTDNLFMTVFAVAPGSEYTGSHIEESRLLALLSGDLECNGQQYKPGQFLWLAPNETSSWKVRAGALGAVLYDVPNPNGLPA